MANNYEGWLCEESWKPPSSRPILIYFEFRSKPSLISVMHGPSPHNFICDKILFSHTRRWLEFLFLYFFLFRFFVILRYYQFLTKNILLLSLFFFFHENYFYFFRFRDVPACSGMFRVLGFIDAPLFCLIDRTWQRLKNWHRNWQFVRLTMFGMLFVESVYSSNNHIMWCLLRFGSTDDVWRRVLFYCFLQTFLQCFTVTTKRFAGFANLKVIWNEDFPFSSI